MATDRDVIYKVIIEWKKEFTNSIILEDLLDHLCLAKVIGVNHSNMWKGKTPEEQVEFLEKKIPKEGRSGFKAMLEYLFEKETAFAETLLVSLGKKNKEFEEWIRRAQEAGMYGHFLEPRPKPSLQPNSTSQKLYSHGILNKLGEKYPEHTGYPLQPDSEGPTYYRMEMHYDNPQLIDGIHDDSGLTIYYTDNLRTYDMGTIVLGYIVTYTQLVPPGLGDFMTVGHCPGECTEMYIPPEGIHIFSGLLHSHLLGRKMRARIFRDGEELPWILHDEHYDFNYQQSRVLWEEFHLLPGDHITVECDLDSLEREDVFLGGLTTYDEMCEFFVMYYPRVEKLNLCFTSVEYEFFHDLFQLGGVHLNLVEKLNLCFTSVEYEFFHDLFQLGGVHLNLESLNWELDGTNQTLHEYFRGFDWENFDLETYQEAVRFSPQQGICGDISDFLEVKDVTFPEYESDYSPPPRKCPTWERHKTLDRDGIMHLYWTPDIESGEITFELHAKTQGWAGLGFSANGAMPGSDVVVGWIKDGQIYFTTWERHESLDRDGIMNLYWTPDLESGEITFELHAKTQGWAGLGFSANGAMIGSDIVVGWIKDGQTFFTDRHAVGNELPLVDESQDYELLFASEDEEGLTLRFKRLIDTCDEDDFYITSDTWSLIYAYAETDPDGEDPFYHGRDNRGVKSLNLLDPQIGDIPDEPGLKMWEMRNDVIIPAVYTSYWCSVFKPPQTDTKQHIIGYHPWVTEGNEEYVHHYTVMTCTVKEGEEVIFEQFMQDYPQGSPCLEPHANILYDNCQSIVSAWAVGGVGENYPKNAGYPLNPITEGPTYFMMELHYDNPLLIEGIHDDSGQISYYTDNLRTYDMDLLSMGRKMRARIFRDGEELPWILHDEHYDFNYQQSRVLREEFTLLPGDHIVTECELDSSDRDLVTLGGLTTHDEMCQFFVMYYPKVEGLMHCASNVDFQYFHTLFQVGGINLSPESLDWEVDGTNQTLREYLRDFDWENFDLEAYQESVRFNPQLALCGRFPDVFEVEDVTFPEYESDYHPPPRQCPFESPNP
ncbi:unnamed protein product [Darwinula stevensoni]|uniref:DOMON domain-containing protein n=1 Tax=Darwinula stevensoni TaxID=69355 RepID=A0A7R8XK42_9CRUS|nr:unnamed protein product [Darwinula stevensoni]CAG0892814.1 unnamed protein product [Darwinula stevensoni]